MRQHFAILTFFVIAFASLGVSAQEFCPPKSAPGDVTMVGRDFSYFTFNNNSGMLINRHAFYPINKETVVPSDEGVNNSFGPLGVGNYRIVTRVAVVNPANQNQIIVIELVRRRQAGAAGYLKSWFTTDLSDYSDAISFTQRIYQFKSFSTQATMVTYSFRNPLLEDPTLENDYFFSKKIDLIQALKKLPKFNVKNLSDPKFMDRPEMRKFRKEIDQKGSSEYGYVNQDEFKFISCAN